MQNVVKSAAVFDFAPKCQAVSKNSFHVQLRALHCLKPEGSGFGQNRKHACKRMGAVLKPRFSVAAYDVGLVVCKKQRHFYVLHVVV